MSEAFEIKAPAKTNLWLRILGKREDGFHEIETRMVALTLADTLRLEWRKDEDVVLRCSDPELPGGEENLVVKAVRALERRVGKTLAVSIDLKKRIPSGAGLGGGSSDAAAVLKALNKMGQLGLSESELAEVGAEFGSDIPFFLYDQPCDCRGRGEVVMPVADELPSGRFLLMKPAFGISAAWAYQHYAESGEYEGFTYAAQPTRFGDVVNDLERPAFEKFPILGDMKNWLLERKGVEAAMMSGSGSTMLAFLSENSDPDKIIRKAKKHFGKSTWMEACETG
ncbi:MAG: 4-(cytidine 5'-diphospho)-2-C-methyl-D-erythritol kinase [Verrucomicrobiota bacterium]